MSSISLRTRYFAGPIMLAAREPWKPCRRRLSSASITRRWSAAKRSGRASGDLRASSDSISRSRGEWMSISSRKPATASSSPAMSRSRSIGLSYSSEISCDAVGLLSRRAVAHEAATITQARRLDCARLLGSHGPSDGDRYPAGDRLAVRTQNRVSR